MRPALIMLAAVFVATWLVAATEVAIDDHVKAHRAVAKQASGLDQLIDYMRGYLR